MVALAFALGLGVGPLTLLSPAQGQAVRAVSAVGAKASAARPNVLLITADDMRFDDLKFMPKVSEYYSFYSWFMLGLGLVFQLPVVIFVLSRIGIVTPRFLMHYFKYAVLAAFVISAVITPSGDMVTQAFVAIPIIVLYLVGVLVAFLFGRPRKVEVASTSPAA